MRLGYEASNSPFYTKFQKEMYYKGHHVRRQYLPMTLETIQLMVDTGRLDTSRPVDLTQLCRTKLIKIDAFDDKVFGVQLTDIGLDNFRVGAYNEL